MDIIKRIEQDLKDNVTFIPVSNYNEIYKEIFS